MGKVMGSRGNQARVYFYKQACKIIRCLGLFLLDVVFKCIYALYMSDKNKVLFRFVAENIKDVLSKGVSSFILGVRQVGNTTLAGQVAEKLSNYIYLLIGILL